MLNHKLRTKFSSIHGSSSPILYQISKNHGRRIISCHLPECSLHIPAWLTSSSSWLTRIASLEALGSIVHLLAAHLCISLRLTGTSSRVTSILRLATLTLELIVVLETHLGEIRMLLVEEMECG
jgi:hypothetical protein